MIIILCLSSLGSLYLTQQRFIYVVIMICTEHSSDSRFIMIYNRIQASSQWMDQLFENIGSPVHGICNFVFACLTKVKIAILSISFVDYSHSMKQTERKCCCVDFRQDCKIQFNFLAKIHIATLSFSFIEYKWSKMIYKTERKYRYLDFRQIRRNKIANVMYAVLMSLVNARLDLHFIAHVIPKLFRIFLMILIQFGVCKNHQKISLQFNHLMDQFSYFLQMRIIPLCCHQDDFLLIHAFSIHVINQV